MTRSNDLCTVAEAYLIAELVMRRGSLWRRVLRLVLWPIITPLRAINAAMAPK